MSTTTQPAGCSATGSGEPVDAYRNAARDAGPGRAPTVREVTHRLLERRGLTTLFGNPGSNELPFLSGLPVSFRYVLGLHEGVVVGMADGFSQASGRPALVNLHSASGTGNAMGALTNAAHSRTPLVVTAGQQVRTAIGLQAMLANVDAAQLARPLVGFSAEPACAADVPRTLAQAVFEAEHGLRGPAYVSVPYDDWAAPVDTDPEPLLAREVTRAARLGPAELDVLARQVRSATRLALVLGSDLDGRVPYGMLVALAERLDADVYAAPSPFRLPYPNRHRRFRGVLPAGIASVASALAGHDLAVVVGAPVFRYHQHEPGEYLPSGTRLLQLTDDAGAATRAPVGTAVICDPAAAVADLCQALDVTAGEPVPDGQFVPCAPVPAAVPGAPLSPAEVFATLRRTLPRDTAYVVESTSTNADWWSQMDLREPGSYYWPASGGLGFGLPAAVGVALARPDRRVVAVVGDGSANYGITALWTAAQEGMPVDVVVLRNGTYGALRWFAEVLDVSDAPGLDIPGIDLVPVATGYGVPGYQARTCAELAALLCAPDDGPRLIQVDTTPSNPAAPATS